MNGGFQQATSGDLNLAVDIPPSNIAPHNADTTPAQRAYRTCGHYVTALRAGALLHCPDAQKALRKPFLSSPPIMEPGS
jgi:hypothetical protein